MIVPDKIHVIANWKMKPENVKQARKLASELVRPETLLQVVVCPPLPFLNAVSKERERRIALGAQNTHWEVTGSHSGEISPSQLASVDIEYVIVGHSFRRSLGETDEEVNKKVRACLRHNLIPVVCIGETVRDGSSDYLKIVEEQIKACFAKISKEQFEHIIIAYEPIWAISSTPGSRDATSQDVEAMIIFIKKVIDDMTGNIGVGRLNIIYGGSVDTSEEVRSFLKAGAQGVLVGSKSLDAEGFNMLIQSATAYVKAQGNE